MLGWKEQSWKCTLHRAWYLPAGQRFLQTFLSPLGWCRKEKLLGCGQLEQETLGLPTEEKGERRSTEAVQAGSRCCIQAPRRRGFIVFFFLSPILTLVQ